MQLVDTSGARIKVSSNERKKDGKKHLWFCFVDELAGDGDRLLDGNDFTKWQSDGEGNHWFQIELPSEVESIEALEFRLGKVQACFAASMT